MTHRQEQEREQDLTELARAVGVLRTPPEDRDPAYPWSDLIPLVLGSLILTLFAALVVAQTIHFLYPAGW